MPAELGPRVVSPSVCPTDLYFRFPAIPAIIGDYFAQVSLLSILSGFQRGSRFSSSCSEIRSPRPVTLRGLAPYNLPLTVPTPPLLHAWNWGALCLSSLSPTPCISFGEIGVGHTLQRGSGHAPSGAGGASEVPGVGSGLVACQVSSWSHLALGPTQVFSALPSLCFGAACVADPVLSWASSAVARST